MVQFFWEQAIVTPANKFILLILVKTLFTSALDDGEMNAIGT